MSPGSPSVRDTHNLIYAGTLSAASEPNDSDENDSEYDEAEDESNPNVSAGEEGPRRQSMYLTLFEVMLTEVLEHESHLLSLAEINFFQDYNKLDYFSKYILVRLCLRRSPRWVRYSGLENYKKELGSAFLSTIQALCTTEPQETVKQEGPDVIDLTLDEDDRAMLGPPAESAELLIKPESLPAPTTNKPEDGADDDDDDVDYYDGGDEDEDENEDFSFFLHDHTHASLHELLECLKIEELKDLCKTRKIRISRLNKKGVLRRAALVSRLLSDVLPHSQLPSNSIDKRPLRQSTLSFANVDPAESLRKQIVKKLKLCVRINKSMMRLIRRVNLIYFRCTQMPEGVLIPSISKYAKKRNYEEVAHSRTPDVWPSRKEFLAYGRALALEAEVDELINSRKPVRGKRSFTTLKTTPLFVLTKGKENVQEELQEEKPREMAAKRVKAIVEFIYPEWQALLQTKGEPRTPGLERFEQGHVLTRIVQKGAEQLYYLKEHTKSLDYIQALLSQHRWRRTRRGLWYEKRALILMNHSGQKSSKDVKKLDDPNVLEDALTAVIEALEDPETHLVYRPMLERRLTTLETKLKLPPAQCHTSEGRLVDPKHISISRVPAPQNEPLHLDKTRRPKQASAEATPVKPKQTLTRFNFIAQIKPQKGSGNPVVKDEPLKVERKTGRTKWIGRGGEIVDVETLALQYYQDQGYTGYHCEGGILCTIFGLLFWDIIFAPIPGAFETAYQSAPLDFAGDSFYVARKELVAQRLVELQHGRAAEILERIDAEHREKKTWCVGVHWEYSREDLREIIDCFDGQALALICELFCQDYAKRCSGMPDLFLWDIKKKHCKLVEVKSPNDTLQENQKVWIDVLHRAEVDIEVCHVEDASAGSSKNTGRRGARRKRAAALPEPESEDEEEFDEPMEDLSPGPSRKRAADEGGASSPSKRLRRKTRCTMDGSLS